MTFLDFLVIVILVLSIASSAANGVIRGSLALIASLMGLIVAARFYDYGASFFQLVLDDTRLCNFLGFVTILLLIVAIGSALSYWLRGTLQGAGITWIDKFLGASFGLARGWLIASTIYLGLMAFPVRFETVEQARLTPYLAYGTQAITYAASAEVRSKFFESYLKLQKEWSKKERSSKP